MKKKKIRMSSLQDQCQIIIPRLSTLIEARKVGQDCWRRRVERTTNIDMPFYISLEFSCAQLQDRVEGGLPELAHWPDFRNKRRCGQKDRYPTNFDELVAFGKTQWAAPRGKLGGRTRVHIEERYGVHAPEVAGDDDIERIISPGLQALHPGCLVDGVSLYRLTLGVGSIASQATNRWIEGSIHTFVIMT